MTEPASQPPDTAPDRADDARSADLAELLGHTAACWDEQRRQLARQLHDSLGSSMTALTMHLALLTQQLPADKALRERSAQMKQLLANIINTNREMQLALWNDKLEFLGIKAAIAEQVEEFRGAHRLTARVSLPEQDESYPREYAVALLRCLEEGLRNIAAHAQASEIDVILDDDGDQVMLTVRDNGIGPGPAPLAQDGGGHGLRLLRERAAYLGGRLSVEQAPQQPGTALTLILPHPANAAGAALSAA
jgi:signal transduction histidine kinase